MIERRLRVKYLGDAGGFLSNTLFMMLILRIWRVYSRLRSTLALTRCGSGNPGNIPFLVYALCERFQKRIHAFRAESGMLNKHMLTNLRQLVYNAILRYIYPED